MANPIRAHQDATSAARYIAEMSADLADMARRHGLETLGYLLEMAKLEAQNTTGPAAAPEDD